jgi:hypothetical protein
MGGDYNRTEDDVEAAVEAERLRIAAWLHAKSDETEALLKVAAERGDIKVKGAQLFFATKTRVLIEVLARMVETNNMPLKPTEKP